MYVLPHQGDEHPTEQGTQVPCAAAPRFSVVHAAYRPAQLKLYARSAGHMKGIMRWGPGAAEHLAAALGAPGRSLVFCYANNLVRLLCCCSMHMIWWLFAG